MRSWLKDFSGSFRVNTYEVEGEKRERYFINEASPHHQEYLEIVRKCHEDILLPSEWIFEKCYELASRASEYDDMEDNKWEIVEGCVDIYTRDLFRWGAKFSCYVDDARSEGLIPQDTLIDRQLMIGQGYQLGRMLDTIVEGLEGLYA